jgi:hypothetical protein
MPSRAYSRLPPSGVVIVSCAWPGLTVEQRVENSGVPGKGGLAFTTALADAEDIHPEELVTINVYVPGSRPVTVKVVPDPAVVTAPGFLVSTQEPVDGNPLNGTLPVKTAHVGCTIVPITGGVGVNGWAFMTALEDAGDAQPFEPATVNVYVPDNSPVNVVVEPVPVSVRPPGLAVIVHVPAGKPLRATLPAATRQVG